MAAPVTYKASTVNILTWEEIESYYSGLISKGWRLESMLSLVKFIRSGDLANRLFAYTSLDILIITIYNPAELHRECLHIKLTPLTKLWQFEYSAVPYQPVEMSRSCAEEDGIKKFCQFIQWLKW